MIGRQTTAKIYGGQYVKRNVEDAKKYRAFRPVIDHGNIKYAYRRISLTLLMGLGWIRAPISHKVAGVPWYFENKKNKIKVPDFVN